MDFKYITTKLTSLGVSQNSADMISITIIALIALLATWGLYKISKYIILKYIKKIVEKSKNQWDDLLFEKKIFNRLAYLIPFTTLYIITPLIFESEEIKTISIFQKTCKIAILIVILLIIDSALNVLLEYYSTFKNSKNRPIKGYIQVGKIIINFIGIILLLSIFLDKDPASLLAGLGAMTAILLLIFKDSILGFVAGIQITANNMVNIGDWITFSKYNADGTVIDISLNTVKVQNFDKTITTIPTYSLVSESFQNWRGMEESGGRRIKRSINIDITSIKFCNEELLHKFKKIDILEKYVKEKLKELSLKNSDINNNTSSIVNGERLTNIGIFRKYIELFLTIHPEIRNDMTFLVRQLQPTEKGIPLEIYIFSKVKSWSEYENIQADIFDHLLAAIHEFELTIFQNPTGGDFKRLNKNSDN